MIVNGFCREVFRELAMESAVEAHKLLSLSLEGAWGDEADGAAAADRGAVREGGGEGDPPRGGPPTSTPARCTR